MSIPTQDIRAICQDALRWREFMDRVRHGDVDIGCTADMFAEIIDAGIEVMRRRHELTSEVRS
jgi:hypothetical protein